MRGKRSWSAAGVMALGLLLGACGGGGAQNTGQNATIEGGQAAATQRAAPTQAAAKVRRGGTLMVALDLNPKSFDPRVYTDVYSAAVVGNVFDTLVRHDDKLVPQPWLAEKIDHPDELTYVFTLRKGVKFHDGTELDAEAVKFSIDRVREYKSGPAYNDAQYIADSLVVDKYTYKLVLKEPFSPFLSYLDGRIGTIVSPAAVKKQGDEDFGLHPVGSGPFKFGEWRSDNYVRVTRNENYWEQAADGKALPYLDGVEWKIITEPAGRLTALQAGDVHISSVRDADLPVVKKDSSLTFAQQPGFNWGGLLLTITRPPFDNRALRQAVAYGIDREEIVKAILEGNGEPANGPAPIPMAWARDETYKPFTYNAAKVKEKLAEGGRPNGFEFTAYFSAGSATTQQLAELMQAQLARVGITMKLEYADFNGVVIPKAKAQESNAYSIGLNCGPDPDQCVSARFLKGSGFNYSQYDNPQVNELILAARRTSDREARAKLYKQVVPLIAEDASFIFTTHSMERFTGSTKVEGWYLGFKLTRGYSEFWLKEQ